MTGPRWAADASAILAVLRGESGAQTIREKLPDSVLGAANAAEVVSKLMVRGMSADQAETTVRLLPCDLAEIDGPLGILAGRIHAQTRAHGLAPGDCLCLALARRDALVALTTDRAWVGLPLDIGVELAR